jgi:hypothetical protein
VLIIPGGINKPIILETEILEGEGEGEVDEQVVDEDDLA